MNQWKSVKHIQWFCERTDVKHIVDQRKLLFLRRLVHSKNVVQTCLASYVGLYILKSFMVCATSRFTTLISIFV